MKAEGKETSMYTVRQMEVLRSTQRLSDSPFFYITSRLTTALERLPHYTVTLPSTNSSSGTQAGVTVML
jgi:hypothetical protein